MTLRAGKFGGVLLLEEVESEAEAFVEANRLRGTVGGRDPDYRYEEDVEQFFRHSPSVVRDLSD